MNKCTFLFRPVLIALALLGLSTYLIGQSIEIKGKIIDKETSQGIDLVTVYSKDFNSYTFTNEDGSFSLKIPFKVEMEQLNLLIQRLGYKRKIVNISPSAKDISIELDKDIRSLPTVTISGSKRTKKINAKDLVEKAIIRIPYNYSVSPYLTTGYLIKKSTFKKCS